MVRPDDNLFPPAVVRSDDSRAELMAQVKIVHARYVVGERKTLETSNELGGYLVKIKAKCKHGEWLPCLAELGISRYDAWVCIQIFKCWAPNISDAKSVREVMRLRKIQEKEDEEPPLERDSGGDWDGQLCSSCERVAPVLNCKTCAHEKAAPRDKRAEKDEEHNGASSEGASESEDRQQYAAEADAEEATANIPERLRPVFACGNAFDTASRAAERAANAVQIVEESAAYKAVEDHERSLDKRDLTKRMRSSSFRTFAREIGALKPVALCPDCKGNEPSRDAEWCKQCGGKGFLIADDIED